MGFFFDFRLALHQLDEETSRAPGMEESNLVAAGPEAWSLVDEIEAFVLQPGEGYRKIGDSVRDVMESLAPFL